MARITLLNPYDVGGSLKFAPSATPATRRWVGRPSIPCAPSPRTLSLPPLDRSPGLSDGAGCSGKTMKDHYHDCCCPDCCHKRLDQEKNDMKTWGAVAVVALVIWILLS